MKRIILCSQQYTSYIDTSTTGVSYYDDFLSSKELNYLQKQKNRTGKIVMMSPRTYYHECAHRLFHTSVRKLKQSRNRDNESLEWMRKQLQSGDKLELPYINYADTGQEGLHRMMVLGDMFGWDTEFPVLVVDVYDKQQEYDENLYSVLRRLVNSAKTYSYREDRVVDEFYEQLIFDLENDFENTKDIEITVEQDDDMIHITAKDENSQVSMDIALAELRLRSSEDSLDIDDIDEYLSTGDLIDLLK